MIIIDDNKENKVLINSTKQWLKSTFKSHLLN